MEININKRMRYASINPVNNQVVKRFGFTSRNEILKAIGRSSTAFERFKRTSLEERISRVNTFANSLEKRTDQLVGTVCM